MQRLLSLPGEYRLYVGHDYPQNRDQVCFSTVAEQREKNKHVKQGTDAAEFIKFRGSAMPSWVHLVFFIPPCR